MKPTASLSILFAAMTAAAQAVTVIYQDDFNNPSGINSGGPYVSSLGGSAPTVRTGLLGGSASATWTNAAETGGHGQRDINDSNVATPTSSNYLAFVPQQGYVYTLSAEITVNTIVNDNWFAIGFTSSNGNWGPLAGALTVADYNITTQQGIVRWNATNVGQTRLVTYTLDTTAPSWTNANNIAYVGWFTAGAGQVNINGANQVSIDNFSLTAVPEPSTALLGGLSVLALLRRRR
ncbi:MAG: PEP-CTERM sorting domain-containing protein [Verrucomicrobia bacterium]|nr:MAG: PEP-CTERM sorting domain-containing protein [Verrucomicrobiota bacterium]